MASIIAAFVAMATAIITISAQRYNASQQEEIQKEQTQIAQENVENNKDISDKNFNLTKEQFEYQKQLNELQMKREDTAMQRQVADLKQAGLSPLMASGGSSTGQLISASAPQYDMSGINSAISNLLGIKQDYASRKQAAYQFERQQTLQIAQQYADLTSLKLDNDYKRKQIEAMEIANAYNSEHGLRDPNLQTYLVDLIEKYFKERNIDPSKAASDKIEEAKDYVKNTLVDDISNAIDEVKTIPDRVTEYATNNIVAPVVRTYQGAGKSIKESGKKVWNTTKEGAKKGWKKVKGWFGK